MNITRLLSVVLIGSVLLLASAPFSEAQRAPRGSTLISPPPPDNEESVSPR
jgi:hypothetical protein